LFKKQQFPLYVRNALLKVLLARVAYLTIVPRGNVKAFSDASFSLVPLVRGKTLRAREVVNFINFIASKDLSAMRLGRGSLQISVGLVQLRLKIDDFFSRKISDLASHPLHKVVLVILARK
jgi:hypothetical protein